VSASYFILFPFPTVMSGLTLQASISDSCMSIEYPVLISSTHIVLHVKLSNMRVALDIQCKPVQFRQNTYTALFIHSLVLLDSITNSFHHTPCVWPSPPVPFILQRLLSLYSHFAMALLPYFVIPDFPLIYHRISLASFRI